MGQLKDLKWLNRFLSETPGDSEVGGPSRQVPNACWSRVLPTPSPSPKLCMWSIEMAEKLGLEKGDAEILGGGAPIEGMDPYAQRYGGHQFGNWAGQLGDGRAITLGEADTGDGVLELQLKGSGETPYSRHSDGKAVLRSSIREFLCSEAMFHLGVPTTRALSLVTTGEQVMRDVLYNGNKQLEPGAIVCRVAPSFIRLGSFQIHAMMGDKESLEAIVKHTLINHFPDCNFDEDGIIKWARKVAKSTAEMIAHWMRVGFVHGVMNTDNMSIHGLTIDYGPYGWLEDYNPGWTPNTTDSGRRRYRYGAQPQIGAWNIARFLEAISPLVETTDSLTEILEFYISCYEEEINQVWASKLGLDQFKDSDSDLISEMNELLQKVETDMTIFFRELCNLEEPDVSGLTYAFYDKDSIPTDDWNSWLKKWWMRVDGRPNRKVMRATNPKYVLRNWMAQLAIDAATKEDFSVCEKLHNILKRPYEEQVEHEKDWYKKRPEWARHRVGCSMLSCSS
ncbi:MAG: YdiU family protein [Candidatus Thermoplasmatota archaeon]|nr:YdiU family protein [Candidatus Thermoplasmatota archaeon]